MNLLLPFALLALGLGYGDIQVERFERDAAREIASQLGGDNKTVRVQARPDGLGVAWGRVESATIEARDFSLTQLPFFTEPERSKAGWLGNLTISLKEFDLRGLRIAELHAEIPNSRYDLGLARRERVFRLSKSGEGTGWVKVREDDLADYIVRKYAEVKSCTVRVDRDVVWVEGYGEFLIVNSNFTIIARLVPEEGTRLVLTDAKVYFDWVRAEPEAAKVLLELLNPVVDLHTELGLFDAIYVTDVRLRDGFVLASGRTRVPIRPAPADNPG
ncbi:MAG: hypothetical protein WD716_09250 [Fimbriimonadaceae bacterium]